MRRVHFVFFLYPFQCAPNRKGAFGTALYCLPSPPPMFYINAEIFIIYRIPFEFSFYLLICFSLNLFLNLYIEDITRRREDMNFIFEWLKQYFTNERSE